MLYHPGGDFAATLLLKTTPPRAPRHMLTRARLQLHDPHFRGSPVIALHAPAGFGKSAVLSQWRREALASGSAVAWLTLDDADEPARLVRALVLAVRDGCARPAFGRQLLDGGAAADNALGAVTTWLAEVAASSLDLLLLVDDAEKLPPASTDLLNYLLHNVPSNLRVVVASRVALPLADLLAYGHCVKVGPELLRFVFDETRALVAVRFGSSVQADDAARLHELTEGWPLGLQLALAAMEHSRDPAAALAGLAGGDGELPARVVGMLLAHLDPADQEFLVGAALTDALHPELCNVLTGQADSAARLARLVRDTPLFVVAEDSAWCRLHTLTRDLLRQRLREWPQERLLDWHARAANWLAAHGLLPEAARHAHASGQTELAFDLAERCLLDAVRKGELNALDHWRAQLPEAELARRPRLRLAAAWVIALGTQHRDASEHVARIRAAADPNDAALHYECALIESAAAYYADESDKFLALFAPWSGGAPPSTDPWLLQAHANRLSASALLAGDPAQARRHQQRNQGAGAAESSYVRRWGEFLVAQSYLWEGQLKLARETVEPALARADADLGRRHPLSAMFAALYAATLFEDNRVDAAQGALANRLDVLERSGTPDTLLLAYRTASRCAMAQGQEHRALDLLEAMHAIGVERGLQRLCAASLMEQARLHTYASRGESARALAQKLSALSASEAGPFRQRWLAFLCALTDGYASIASHDWRAAQAPLAQAQEAAANLRLGRHAVEIMALRALAQEQLGNAGTSLLREAQGLAATYGLLRTISDAHPMLATWESRLAGATAPAVAATAAPQASTANRPRALPSMVLTPKEREVLELLARNLSNKEIALALAVGEETVKWHVKNLFGKLDAASRKHVVQRARLLGLLEG
jgi:LuxR family maltose regulon positive regulatory protein